MTGFRTKSRGAQWDTWAVGALVAFILYIFLARFAFGSIGFAFDELRCYLLAGSLAALYGAFVWMTRAENSQAAARKTGGAASAPGEGTPAVARVVPAAMALRESAPALETPAETAVARPADEPADEDGRSGEELYAAARGVPHPPIPDFNRDAAYLHLLGRSAAAGHAPALVKFGEYAMRRGTWVEAYWWIKRAHRHGMMNLDGVLRMIRQNWSRAGFPNEFENVNGYFSAEAGSVGRAMLHLDSGHDAANARDYLKANHPEYL